MCTCSNVHKVGDAMGDGVEKVSGCCVSCLTSIGSICRNCCNMEIVSKIGQGVADGAEKTVGCCSKFCTCCCKSGFISKIGEETEK